MNTKTHILHTLHTVTPKSRTAAPTGRVVELLREINIALHATRVVGRRDEIEVADEREPALAMGHGLDG